jgi:hypothetical protein
MIDNVDEIVSIVFAYIQLLRESNYPDWIFEEVCPIRGELISNATYTHSPTAGESDQ